MRMVTPCGPIERKPRAEDFEIVERPSPTCPEGGVRVKVLYASLDPYIGSVLRGRHMGHAAAVHGGTVACAVVGQVLESRTERARPGDHIYTMDGSWSEEAAVSGDAVAVISAKDAPLSAYLGVLGMPGLTAWAGTTKLAKLHEGDVFLVDAAAGPVGGTAGQIAKLKGAARVVGIAGGPAKGEIVTGRYGFDACIDYKQEGWKDALGAVLPDGLTAFFENVSAEMAMTALQHAQPYARGVLCGLVGDYHTEAPAAHAIHAGLVIGKRAQLMGLVVYDFYPQWDAFRAEASAWLREGKLTAHEDLADGIEALPAHFERLMDGQNEGKALVRFAQE